jgi:transposase
MQGKRGSRQRELMFEEPRTPNTPGRRLLQEIDGLVDWSVVARRSAEFFSHTGRPSIDPIVMVKMMLVGYLFGVPSDRRLVEECADRLSFREFLGYGLSEALPTHASFTHWRQRLGSEFFRALLHDIVRQCVEHGMHLSSARTVDGTSVKAQADEHGPIVSVPAGQDPDTFLASFWTDEVKPSSEPEPPAPEAIPHLADEESEEAAEPLAGPPNARKPKPTPISLHDPDARMQRKGGEVSAFRYHASFCADVATGLVMDATAGALERAETALEHVRRDPFEVRELVADALYNDGETLAALQGLGVTTYVPQPAPTTNYLPASAFTYDAEANAFLCPAGKHLRWYRYRKDKRLHYYIAHESDCTACPLKAKCTKAQRRTVTRTLHAEGLDRCVRDGRRYALLKRSRRIHEHLNRMAKRDHALTRARALGLEAMQIQATLTAIAIDLKKLVWHARAGRTADTLMAMHALVNGLHGPLMRLLRPSQPRGAPPASYAAVQTALRQHSAADHLRAHVQPALSSC